MKSHCDWFNLQEVSSWLSLGFDSVTFESAEKFLESRLVDDTSCLITDIRMHGLTGLDLQQQLIQSGKRVPIIFITAFLSENVRKKALESGAVGVLEKPFSDDHLVKCLNRALDGQVWRNSVA
jgi:FixJ family two-component response regulator